MLPRTEIQHSSFHADGKVLRDYINPRFQPHANKFFFEENSAHTNSWFSWDNFILKTNYSQNCESTCCSQRPLSPKAVSQSQQCSTSSQQSQLAHTLRKPNLKTVGDLHPFIFLYNTAQTFGSRWAFWLSA